MGGVGHNLEHWFVDWVCRREEPNDLRVVEMPRGGRAILTVVAGVLAAMPAPTSAQWAHTSVTFAYSAPLPGGMRGEMMSPSLLGSARRGGPFLSVGFEHGRGLGARIELVYSRHATGPWVEAPKYHGRPVFAADKETTSGAMVSVLIPVTHVSGSPLRVSAGVGVLRTGLRGWGIIGGDAVVHAHASNVAPALGAGLELPIPFAGHDVVLAVRGAQLVSRERGGGYLAAGVGVRW